MSSVFLFCHHWFCPQWSTCPLGPFCDLHSRRPHSCIWLALRLHSVGLWIVLPCISSTFYTFYLVLSHWSNPLLDLYLCRLGESWWNIKKLWNNYSLLAFVCVCRQLPLSGSESESESGSGVSLTANLTGNWQLSNAMLLCYAICIPERCSSASLLQMLPAAPLCCSSAAAVLHKCNWWGYVITG